MATKNNTAIQQAFTLYELRKIFGNRLSKQVLTLVKMGAIARDALAEHDIAKLENTEVESTDGRDFKNGKEAKAYSVYEDNRGSYKFVIGGKALKAKTGDFVLRVYNQFACEVVDFHVPLKYIRKLEGKNGICFSWSTKNGYKRLNQFIVRREEFTPVS